MTKKYYKVVRLNLTSVWSPIKVRYKIGEFVEAPDNYKEFPLSVFDSLKSARSFCQCINGWSLIQINIYECEIEGKYKTPWLPSNYDRLTDSIRQKINKIKKAIKSKKKFLDIAHTQVPIGTVSCKRVKLTKFVE